MMFVDTSAWYAAYVKSDPEHDRVRPLIDSGSSRLITTDFVLAESLNLLRARSEYQRAILLGRDLLAHLVAELVYVTPADLEHAFILFSTYRDKQWSYVDCTSLVVMQRLSLREAVSLDRHFHEMPGIVSYP